MQSEESLGGSQADMLQAIFNKMNKQKMDMENNMAMQLDNFKRELQGATSSVSSEVKKLKAEQTNVWKHPGNKDQFDHSENISESLTQALWALNNNKYDYCKESFRKQLNFVINVTNLSNWQMLHLVGGIR